MYKYAWIKKATFYELTRLISKRFTDRAFSICRSRRNRTSVVRTLTSLTKTQCQPEPKKCFLFHLPGRGISDIGWVWTGFSFLKSLSFRWTSSVLMEIVQADVACDWDVIAHSYTRGKEWIGVDLLGIAERTTSFSCMLIKTLMRTQKFKSYRSCWSRKWKTPSVSL